MNEPNNRKPAHDMGRAAQGSKSGKQSPYAAVDNSAPSGDWHLGECDSGDLRLMVAAVLAAGDAIMFSAARKGCAYGVTVYHDGEPTKLWASDLEAFEEIVGKITRIALERVPQAVKVRLTTE